MDQFLIKPQGSINIIGRLKYIWERTDIKHNIRKFEELNKVFLDLVNEIVQILSDNDLNRQVYKHKLAETLRINDQESKFHAYKNIQHASSGLYKTMSEKWRCGVHQKHVVHLSGVQGSQKHEAFSPVSFMTVITGIDDDYEHLKNLKIEVQYDQCGDGADSINSPMVAGLDKSIEATRKGAEMTQSKPRQISPDLKLLASSLQKTIKGQESDTRTRGKAKKERARFSLMHDNIPLESLKLSGFSVPEHNISQSQSKTTVLEHISDHCSHLEEQDKYCLEKACLRYHTDQCVVRFYLRPEEQDIDRQLLSLADLIRQISQDSLIQVLPLTRIMSFASSLADVVLQFYSSPWLPERWESKDIHLFETMEYRENEEPARNSVLYVSLNFGKDSKGKEVIGRSGAPLGEHISNIQLAQQFDVETRNQRLFCLGIVLLELGYTKPWEVLRARIIEKFPTHPGSYHSIAETLARRLVRHVGMDYVRIVRKCIRCDFGLGETNLDKEELQKRFVQDVIEVLRAVGKELSTL